MKKMRGEDFEIWYPTWDTSFTVVQQGKTETGPFKILYAAQHLANASYRTNNYAVFHGGDVGNLKIINNNVTVNRKKILFIKNSFALAVVPLLALQTYEIHEIDPRCQSAPSIQQYISDEKPDIVIVFMDIVSLEKNILKHRW